MDMSKKRISLPTQMEICFGEKCNLDCDYCFVNKTSQHVLSLKKIKKAVDIFLNMSKTAKTITFNSSEPFLYPELFVETVKYIFGQADKLKFEVRIVATSNGVLLNDEMRKFINGLDKRFTLNLSLDGERDCHDAHRKLNSKTEKSSFDRAIGNFEKFSRKDNVRIITTIAPDMSSRVRENMNFIFEKKFKNIDIFPQLLTIWKADELGKFQSEMAEFIDNYNSIDSKMDVRLLNRLWGATDYAGILLGSDGKFYMFEWVLPLEYSKRSAYVIGDTEKGVSLAKRQALLETLFDMVKKSNNGKCSKCVNNSFCSNPIPLYLWCLHSGKNFEAYFENFCQLAGIVISLSEKLKNKNDLDLIRWQLLKNDQ